MSKFKMFLVVGLVAGLLLPSAAAQASLPSRVSVDLVNVKWYNDGTENLAVDYQLQVSNHTSQNVKVCGTVTENVKKKTVDKANFSFTIKEDTSADLLPSESGVYTLSGVGRKSDQHILRKVNWRTC